MNDAEKYAFWLTDAYFDDNTKKELAEIKDDRKEIADRFEGELNFGTGGLRGIMGAGTNRINIYTVRRASQGLAAYIRGKGTGFSARGVAVAYDSRHNSVEFAMEAARVFAGNGIPAYLFGEAVPTPMLSFAVRQLGAAAGVVITASHNPRQYNGYKVYGADGGQLVPRDTGAIADEIGRVGITRIKLADYGTARDSGLIRMIGADLHGRYAACVKQCIIDPDIVREYAGRVNIVYTPLNGTGGRTVLRVLDGAGFTGVYPVKSQLYPDGDFPGVRSSLNPEDAAVYDEALKIARKTEADLIIATDPDCDRAGVMVKTGRGRYTHLTGNQAGVLMLEYLLARKSALGRLPKDGFAVKTIVTTQMACAIAKRYAVRMIDVLTGFKYIGEKIRALHDTGGGTFLFGLEDSCGYLAGTDVRDKDGVIACLLLAEIAAYYKSRGMRLADALKRLGREYGHFATELVTIGISGRAASHALPPDALGDLGVIAVRDYRKCERHDLITGARTALALPQTDAVYFELRDNAWVCIRPSGTEEKLKLYFEACGKTARAARRRLRSIKKRVLAAVKTQP